MHANDDIANSISTGKRKKQAATAGGDLNSRAGQDTSDNQRFSQVRAALGQTLGNVDAGSGIKRQDFEDTKLSDPSQPKKSRSTAALENLKEDLIYAKKVNDNTVRFDEVCSIPLTNLIGKFLRDLVSAGKTFSLVLQLDKTPDALAQVNHLLKESKFAYKYADRLSLRQHDEFVRNEYFALKNSLMNQGSLLSRPVTHQRLVVEDYQRIPEAKREEIEHILSRSRARDSFKVVDGKTFVEQVSMAYSPDRTKILDQSKADQTGFQNSYLSGTKQDQSAYPGGKKPSVFMLYRNETQNGLGQGAGLDPRLSAPLPSVGGIREVTRLARATDTTPPLTPYASRVQMHTPGSN